MILSRRISSINSHNIDVKKYRISIYGDSHLIYTYNRSQINYGNGNWLPTFKTISDEANKMISGGSFASCNHSYLGNMSVTLSRNMLNLSYPCTPNNNDVLGSYLNSSFLEQLNHSFIPNMLRGTKQIHYFKYGYIKEIEYFLYKYIQLTDGVLELITTTPNDSEHSLIECRTYYLNYIITSVDTRIETDCCVLVCCEPNKYKLIT